LIPERKKKKKPKKVKARLPNKLFAIPNADKAFHEKWYKGRNMINIPHPWRGMFIGPPNKGKSQTIKHILLRTKPEFEEVFCVHCDGKYTDEWDDVGVQMLESIPAPDEWLGEVKTLVILDDLEYNGMDKIQKSNLNRLFGYVSTHKNISVALTSQDAFNVPSSVRRCANLWVMWRCPDMDAMSMVGRKSGIKAKNFNGIFDQLLCEEYDSLWLDTTAKTPYPKRKNGFILINQVNGEDTIKEEENGDKFTEQLTKE